MYARTNFVLNISAFGVVRSVCTGAVDSVQVRNASTVHFLVARSDTLRFLEVDPRTAWEPAGTAVAECDPTPRELVQSEVQSRSKSVLLTKYDVKKVSS